MEHEIQKETVDRDQWLPMLIAPLDQLFVRINTRTGIRFCDSTYKDFKLTILVKTDQQKLIV